MRCVIVLNGDFTEKFDFLSGDHIIACDGAYDELVKRGVMPGEVLGDFDSLGYVPKGATVYPVEKDMTDGEIALERAAEIGADSVSFICAGGKRDDHFLGNLSLLYKAYDLGIDAELYTDYSIARLLGAGKHRFFVKAGAILSLVSFGGAVVSDSVGLKYPFKDTSLTASSTLGISNEAINDEVLFTVKEGFVLFIINI